MKPKLRLGPNEALLATHEGHGAGAEALARNVGREPARLDQLAELLRFVDPTALAVEVQRADGRVRIECSLHLVREAEADRTGNLEFRGITQYAQRVAAEAFVARDNLPRHAQLRNERHVDIDDGSQQPEDDRHLSQRGPPRAPAACRVSLGGAPDADELPERDDDREEQHPRGHCRGELRHLRPVHLARQRRESGHRERPGEAVDPVTDRQAQLAAPVPGEVVSGRRGRVDGRSTRVGRAARWPRSQQSRYAHRLAPVGIAGPPHQILWPNLPACRHRPQRRLIERPVPRTVPPDVPGHAVARTPLCEKPVASRRSCTTALIGNWRAGTSARRWCSRRDLRGTARRQRAPRRAHRSRRSHPHRRRPAPASPRHPEAHCPPRHRT